MAIFALANSVLTLLWAVFRLIACQIYFNSPTGGGGFDDNDFDRGGASAPFFGQLPFDGPVSGVGVAALIGIVLLGLLIFLVFFILVVISNGGLADSVAAIDRAQRRGFGSTWRAGTSRF